ncbi:hypothetical protein Tsubulata_013344, partial [Turnera subulata]
DHKNNVPRPAPALDLVRARAKSACTGATPPDTGLSIQSDDPDIAALLESFNKTNPTGSSSIGPDRLNHNLESRLGPGTRPSSGSSPDYEFLKYQKYKQSLRASAESTQAPGTSGFSQSPQAQDFPIHDGSSSSGLVGTSPTLYYQFDPQWDPVYFDFTGPIRLDPGINDPDSDMHISEDYCELLNFMENPHAPPVIHPVENHCPVTDKSGDVHPSGSDKSIWQF